ncbi:MAG TPA: c-type cytochrome [Chryseolinea sp.]
MILRKDPHPYLLFLLLAFAGCTYRTDADLVNCETNHPVIAIEAKTDPTGCNTLDGDITVSATGGVPPYQFKINDGELQTSGTFTQLNGGSFTLSVSDVNGCGSESTVVLTVASSDLAATYTTQEDNECLSGNGTLAVTATGSNGPFQYKLGIGSFSDNNVFTGLEHGLYTVIVKDSQDCSLSLSASVGRGQTGVSWSADIKPILSTNCAISGCHVSGSQSPDLSDLGSVMNNASLIKARTGSRAMPPDGRSISQEQIDKIACWVDDGVKNN